MNKNHSISICILIDALGWNYIKNRPFLNDIALTKRPVKSILGFSSGVIPSILTGEYPQEHKHWSLYFYSLYTSPFRWVKSYLWLPKKILHSRFARKIIEEISKRMTGYSGYFETYVVPIEQLYLFDICENRNIYAPKGVTGTDSIFDILKQGNIDYQCLTYPLKDKEIFAKAKQSLQTIKSHFYLLYLSELDALLHRACKDSVQVNEMIDYYEKEIRDLYAIATNRFNKVNLCVFSDHGMAAIDNGYNLKKQIEDLGLKTPSDYVAFYDSTMARFWFFNSETKDLVVNLLNNKEYGKILSDNELKTLGVKFENNMYGELVFLMHTGSVICPSFMGSKVPQGMHGFSVDDGVMDAMLVSNYEIKEDLKDVKDFYKLMVERVSELNTQPRKLKILYFLNSTVRAGAEEVVLQLMEYLDRKIFDPILVCPQELIDLIKEELEEFKVRYYSIKIRRWRNLGEIRKFIAILKQEKPDIVHSHLFLATRFAAPLAKFAGVSKVIETAHIREAWRKGYKKAYFVDRFFYRFVDKIIAVSSAVKDYLIKEKKLNEYKIKVIHNGIDLTRFKSPDNLPQNKCFTIGVIGRLESQKGHKDFLNAIHILNGKFEDIRFVIAGEGSLKNELEKQARRLGIANRVEFLGYRRDIESVLKEIDLLVLPSLFEGLPLVALEASAMAKPVIVSDVDGNLEAVQHNRTGLVIPSKDPVALARAITFFYENKEVASKYGENGRSFVNQNFDIRQQVKKTEDLYKSSVTGLK
ncbi:MAG: glycosyltransferase [Candidatus Omnitrophota bacterium]